MNDNYNKENNKKIISRIIIATISIVLAAIIIGAIALVLISQYKNVKLKNTDEYSSYMTRIEDALKRVKEKYIEDVDTEKLVDGAVAGIAEATGDPYTRYMDEEEYNELLTSGKETYGGLGIHITYDTDTQGIIILGIMPDTPAVNADLKIGDIVV